ncbi:hypothetical protein GCM10010912_60180 [Paenibacillus albidus]|uniref:DUF4132 domain-containing protein n=1 Tax=Paenibacillus albidus TaxID=2041023 RepID=A0A917FWH5_9BACL|nr:DUF4132 domain-containing protein [Paenibacillus albidus]GGG07496.1 hypothetical protein GCM10010912_60180 [Paenibacillus albidus]
MKIGNAEWETNGYADMQKKAQALEGEGSELAVVLAELSKNRYLHEGEELYEKCVAILQQRAAEKQTDFAGYWQPLIQVMELLYSAHTVEIVRYIVDHAQEQPYGIGYARRPFRSRELEVHRMRIFNKINALIFMEILEFSLPEYLKANHEKDYSTSYRIDVALADVVAYELDHGDGGMLDLLKEAVYGDNQGAQLSQSMIKGVFLSHNPEALKMTGELLIAARLQEGLRQSIVETMDMGTLSNNLYMLKLIIDNDLIRYSSVVRALGTWTGMGLEAQNQRVARQLIEGAYEVLTDEAVREAWLSDANANHVYLSLWSTAVYEEEDLYGKIDTLMAGGQLYQRIVAQYVLANSENKEIRLASARQYLDEQEPELLYWILTNYNYSYDRMWRASNDEGPRIEVRTSPQLEDKEERRRDFDALKAIFLNPASGDRTGPSKVLDFLQIAYTRDLPVQKMLYLISYDMDPGWVNEVIALRDKLSADLRGELLNYFVLAPEEAVQREFIFASLSDKSMKNREFALELAQELILSEEELQMAEALLKLKTGTLRQSVTRMLLKQPDPALLTAVSRLLQGKNSLQRLAGLEIATVLFEDEARQELFLAVQPHVDGITEPSAKERELMAKMGQKNEYIRANGYGLFDPKQTEPWLAEGPKPGSFEWKHVFKLSLEQIRTFLEGLDQKIHEHRDVEYEAEYYSGYKETLLIGTNFRPLQGYIQSHEDHTSSRLEQYPLHEVWSAYVQESGWEARDLLELNFYITLTDLDKTLDHYYGYYNGSANYEALRKQKLLEGFRAEFAERVYPVQQIRDVQKVLDKLRYKWQTETLVAAFFADSAKTEEFRLADGAVNALMAAFPEEKLEEESPLLNLLIQPFIQMEHSHWSGSEEFKAMFLTSYTLERMLGSKENHSVIGLKNYIKAFNDGMIGEGTLLKELLLGQDNRNHMRWMTSRSHEWIENSPKVVELRARMIERLLAIELGRGDLPTEVTALTMGLERIEGMEYFVRILAGLDQDTFIRGYVYGYGDNITKKESFSHLLKVCHPREGDDAGLLKILLKEYKLSDKKLLEAAMYAPQWIEIIAEYLGWEGLRSAAWYFHAHINEGFSAEKETVVAHYSPITPQDFNDGAFDVKWFQIAYETLGQERFKLLYECAKYISAGANHRRSQLFADATLGKLKLEELKTSAAQKRNKDHLLSYSLIPIRADREQDIRERYEFIQQFLLESKKFGAQRRASEALIVRIALGNLARNAGYADVTRMMWDLESRKLDELTVFFHPFALDEETTVMLSIDDEGQSDYVVISKGKALKSVPSRFKKHEHVEKLKEAKAELTGQYRRARAELERSMESGSTFTVDEIMGITRNPVLAPLLRPLVLKSGEEALGYFAAEGPALVDPDGVQQALGGQDMLQIAHPLDLYRSGQWSLYQKDLFDRQVRQPFKQIFRELYLPNADELANGVLSRRYAGHQVQPSKTVALLKSRQWTVSYEEGLQRVFYAENLIVRLYAMADWFSPADTEAPTLETVQFFDRTTYKEVALDQVPPLIFSEVMRDIDLVVSVAHVGGVDPEASLTTIEMRRVIVNESLRLLKIGNVRMDGNYARIEGTLGEYAVHLGSGQAYKQATGALHIIPVHSQHRGRLFLPFLDEDPRTAEILSKVMLLAQDTMIKDLQILMQLGG